MIGIAVLLQAAPIVPVPSAITPASRTAPIVDAVCKISDSQGHSYYFSIRQSGGRGYRAVQKDGSYYFPRTPLKQNVVRDSAGIFDGFEFESDSGKTWPGTAKALRRPGRVIQVEMMETGNPSKFAVLIEKQWPMAFVHYLGFCDVKKTPQAPLSDAEAQEAGKK